MGRVEGKVALVTGGASGLGEAIARKLHSEGAKVVLADIDADRGRNVANSIGDGAVFVPLDVTSDDSWADAIRTTLEAFGELTVMVMSAGISLPTPIDDMDLDLWQRHIDINLKGGMLGCKNGLPALKASGKPCSIVLISSTQASSPMSNHVAYAASKAGVIGMTKAIGKHCAEQGDPIRVNAVQPGAIHTPMLESYLAAMPDRDAALAMFGSAHPMGRVGQPEEVANMVLFLASDDSSFTTGAALPVDGGILA
ncbi:MAG: SDR family NAD(P)-dependent oxidoreductase [Alphaproteobacteria bacterium]